MGQNQQCRLLGEREGDPKVALDEGQNFKTLGKGI